jgi:hypothetical protein
MAYLVDVLVQPSGQTISNENEKINNTKVNFKIKIYISVAKKLSGNANKSSGIDS